MTGDRDLFTALAEATDIGHEERKRAEKLETELRKLKTLLHEMKIANASALAFIRRHQSGQSAEGLGVRKLLRETMEAA